MTTEDYAIDGPHGVIPLRIYRPATCPSSALLWMHGGGFRHGSIDMQEAHGVSAELAARATALVVSVDYRLAGDGVTFPVPLDDVYAAWKWLASFADSSEIGIRALGGASAGAALALAAALRGRDDSRPADRLLLAYPFAHYPNPAIDDETAREMAALPGILRFPPKTVDAMVADYVGRITDIPALALPGAARLDGLPLTAITLSEFDDLRPSGELLQRQLASVGVPVRTHLAARMPHGHLNHVPVPAGASASLDFLAAALSPTVQGPPQKGAMEGRPRR
ncbi:alpha/beta hydrolase [Streptomyces sp. NBC_00683]|uniref:alpha/beta hydrolase n=1 Tax=Streptomyces sp. NBC_00683 TaxID=2903670 RepID=UPI002E317184|nr:alpha/beta hydrolase fold domain-containing protein [Streptomyces sp. NBC_00683]